MLYWNPENKRNLNKSVKEVNKHLINFKNEAIQDYLLSLLATQGTDYSLWKYTKRLRNTELPPPPFSNGKGKCLCECLSLVFVCYLVDVTGGTEQAINLAFNGQNWMAAPGPYCTFQEIKKKH